MPMPISVIVTTYNRPDALAATLRGLEAQRYRPFEVIIADDGSTGETADFIREVSEKFPVPLKHVWHPDRGFRAAAITNRAIAASTGDYVILMDGDCIPRPCFLDWHNRLAQPGWMVGGNRILLGESFTRDILENSIPVHAWSRASWIKPRRVFLETQPFMIRCHRVTLANDSFRNFGDADTNQMGRLFLHS